MEELSVKDLEFLIEAVENVNSAEILSQRFTKDHLKNLEGANIMDFIKAMNGNEFIKKNHDKMISTAIEFDEELAILRAKLIKIRRQLQNHANA